MGINADKPLLWKSDIALSVDYYNNWFMRFAPETYRSVRAESTVRVNEALETTENLTNLTVDLLLDNPGILPILRMATCPPIARDRLAGLAGVSRTLIKSMEDKENPRLPTHYPRQQLRDDIGRIVATIRSMIDPDIFVWFDDYDDYSAEDVWRAATVVADRLCGADSNPIIRNEQERRQLELVDGLLKERGYRLRGFQHGMTFQDLEPGEYSFRLNIPGSLDDHKSVNIPIDIVVQPLKAEPGSFPLLFEAKSAGDFANVNKRRKEEANKLGNLRRAWGRKVQLNLLLCGYFDTGYLGYVAAEGCDWVWEHRLSDMELFGI